MDRTAFLASLSTPALLSERDEARREMDSYLPSEYTTAGYLRAQALYLLALAELDRRAAQPALAA